MVVLSGGHYSGLPLQQLCLSSQGRTVSAVCMRLWWTWQCQCPPLLSAGSWTLWTTLVWAWWTQTYGEKIVSPVLNESSALERYEHSSMIEIHKQTNVQFRPRTATHEDIEDFQWLQRAPHERAAHFLTVGVCLVISFMRCLLWSLQYLHVWQSQVEIEHYSVCVIWPYYRACSTLVQNFRWGQRQYEMECEVGNQLLRCLAIKTHKQRGGLYIVTTVFTQLMYTST